MSEVAAQAHPQKWAYKTLTLAQASSLFWYVREEDYRHVSDGNGVNQSTVVSDYLTKLGEQGWELVTSYSVTPREGGFPTQPTLLFKKLL